MKKLVFTVVLFFIFTISSFAQVSKKQVLSLMKELNTNLENIEIVHVYNTYSMGGAMLYDKIVKKYGQNANYTTMSLTILNEGLNIKLSKGNTKSIVFYPFSEMNSIEVYNNKIYFTLKD